MADNTMHTPGPWTYSEGSGCVKTSAAVPTVVVARYVDAHNGPVMAVAPELLKAARFAYESLLRLPISERIGRQAELIALRDAIAKATGQSDQEVQDYFTAKAWA